MRRRRRRRRRRRKPRSCVWGSGHAVTRGQDQDNTDRDKYGRAAPARNGQSEAPWLRRSYVFAVPRASTPRTVKDVNGVVRSTLVPGTAHRPCFWRAVQWTAGAFVHDVDGLQRHHLAVRKLHTIPSFGVHPLDHGRACAVQLGSPLQASDAHVAPPWQPQRHARKLRHGQEEICCVRPVTPCAIYA